MVEAALGDERECVIEIGILSHDHRCCTAVLEGTARAGGEPRAKHPADARAADEGEEADTAIANQLTRHVQVGGEQRLTPLLGQTGLAQDGHEAHAGEWRCLGRLYDHRTPGRHAGPHLGCGVQVHRNLRARRGAELLDAQLHTVDSAVDLHQ